MARLAAYQAKRDFSKTAEPRGEDGAGAGDAFVVQKHDASRLHYDLRLELDGAMKSWAVAKGPSLVAGEKRLAIHVEDHPVAYNAFEGTIPKGEYGGGTVMIWDRGRWTPEFDAHKGYAKGHLEFTLAGEKLAGRWHLVRLRKKPGEKQEAWLLIKADDAEARTADAPDILDEQPLSVASGRTMDEIAAAPEAVWRSDRGKAAAPSPARHAEEPSGARPRASRRTQNRPASFETPPGRDPVAPQDDDRGGKQHRKKAGRPDPFPKSVEPCLASLVSKVPSGERWLHEIKWDGYRLLAFRQGGTVRLATRRGLDWTGRFPAIAAGVAALPAESAVLDGEAVVLDARGGADFSALQAALSESGGRVARDAVFYAFDLLYLDGADLRALPLDDRKARLDALLAAGSDTIHLSEHLDGDGPTVLRNACRLGLEGVISKRRDRPYRSGRADDWVKSKCLERQEFVVGGFVPSTAGRKAIGSLLLGYMEGGGLVHAGRTGTGFTAETARDLWRRLDPARRKTSPFAGRLTAEERRGAVYVEPALVAEIEFRGWTGDDHLRHAAFKGLREDKVPADVVRERPVDGATSRDVLTSQSLEADRTLPSPLRGGSSHAPGVTGVGVDQKAPSRSTRHDPHPQPLPARGRGEGSGPVRAGTLRARLDSVAGVTLTHPDRVLWDADGVTKRGLAEFYEGIAEWVLPHVVERPLSLVRCPNGAGDKCFFQKHAWAGLSEHIRRTTVRDEDGQDEEVLFVGDIAGIVGLVQAGVLEIHPWGSRIDDVERADRITMDLDPGDGVPWPDVVAAARDVRERLRAFGLESFVKTTGGKGLHVVLPLSRPAPWPDAKGFAHALSLAMEADDPARYVAKATKSARRGAIYVDYLRNGRGATAVAAYSTRARARPTVSVPLAWEELDDGIAPDGFTVASLPARLAGLPHDPWRDIGRIEQALPAPAKPARGERNRTRKPALASTKTRAGRN